MEAMDVYRALWRHRYLIVILTAVVTATAWFLSSSETKIYKASTLVRIQQKAVDPGQAYSALAVGQQLAKTYAQIVTTRSVRERIGRALGGRVPQSEIDIGASPVQDLALLYITATSQNPQLAAAVANAAPDVLRKFIAESQTINDQIVTISPAGVPASAISPKPMHTAILAFLVALIFNGGLALLIEFFRDRLPEVEELEKAVGKPVLGTIPVLTFTSLKVERLEPDVEGISRTEPVPPAAERVGAIRVPRRKHGVEGVG